MYPFIDTIQLANILKNSKAWSPSYVYNKCLIEAANEQLMILRKQASLVR